MKIKNHKLESENDNEVIIQAPTTNKGGLIKPKFIIIHFTAGSSAESSVEWFKNTAAKASAHIVIGRDGKVFQQIDFNTKAWHAGNSQWGEHNGFNDFSIGIELDNPGRLTSNKSGDKFLSWFKKEYNGENVVEATHKHEKQYSHWLQFTEKQIQACFEICRLLKTTYKIDDILGHDDIAPYRKNDPGPLFPLESFRAKLLGREDDTADVFKITSENTNLRTGPGLEYQSIAQLKKDTKVEFIKNNNGWCYVYVLIEPQNNNEVQYGWVYNKLLKK